MKNEGQNGWSVTILEPVSRSSGVPE